MTQAFRSQNITTSSAVDWGTWGLLTQRISLWWGIPKSSPGAALFCGRLMKMLTTTNTE